MKAMMIMMMMKTMVLHYPPILAMMMTMKVMMKVMKVIKASASSANAPSPANQLECGDAQASKAALESTSAPTVGNMKLTTATPMTTVIRDGQRVRFLPLFLYFYFA